MSAPRLLLVRHPRPVVAPGVCYGRLDLEPEDAHLATLVETLHATLPADAVLLTSPLRRCARVAQALADRGRPLARHDDRLMEMHFGDWEGRAWDDIPRAQIDAWRDDLTGYRPPGGESVTELADRAHAALREALARQAGPLVVITHAGVIQTATRRLRGAPLENFTATRVEYGQVVQPELVDDVNQFDLHNT